MAQSSTRATMKVAAVSRGKLLKGEKANVPGTSHEKKVMQKAKSKQSRVWATVTCAGIMINLQGTECVNIIKQEQTVKKETLKKMLGMEMS